jgi:hypothetical protein
MLGRKVVSDVPKLLFPEKYVYYVDTIRKKYIAFLKARSCFFLLLPL